MKYVPTGKKKGTERRLMKMNKKMVLNEEQFKKLQVNAMKQTVDRFADLELSQIMLVAAVMATYQTLLQKSIYSEELDGLLEILKD